MSEHGREGAQNQGDDLAAGSACWARASTAQSKLSWRETAEGSLPHLCGAVHGPDWRSACGNCGNFPDCTAICAFTCVVHCTVLIGVALAEIAEIPGGWAEALLSRL